MSTNEKELQNLLHNLCWLRKHFGYFKKEMAEILGISVWSFNKIERGEMPPKLRINVLFTVYRHFGITPDSLLSHRRKGL